MVNLKFRNWRGSAMSAFKEFQKSIDTTVEWEKKMFDLYEVAELDIKDVDAKNAIRFLKDYREEDIIPRKVINLNSSADELCSYMLEYEGKMLEFFSFIRDHLTAEKQIELVSA
jgi:hypothetical protein